MPFCTMAGTPVTSWEAVFLRLARDHNLLSIPLLYMKL